jgi:hypothetical protein
MSTVTLRAGLIRNQKLHLLHPIWGIQKCIGHYRTGAFAVTEIEIDSESRDWRDQTEEERELFSVASRKALLGTLGEIKNGNVPFEAVCQRCLGKDIDVIEAWMSKMEQSLEKEGAR